LIFDIVLTTRQLRQIAENLPRQDHIRADIEAALKQMSHLQKLDLGIQLFNRLKDTQTLKTKAAVGMYIVSLTPRSMLVDISTQDPNLKLNGEEILYAAWSALFEIGALKEALPIAKLLVDFWRAQGKKYQPAFATALENLGRNYLKLNRPHEAVNIFEIATSQYQQLINGNESFLRNNLAMVLTNLGIAQYETRQLQAALTNLRLARDIFQSYIAKGEDPARQSLANVLNILGNVLAESQRLPEAIKHYQNARDVYQSIVKGVTHGIQNELAGVLNNLAISLSSVERIDEAIVAFEAARQIYQKSVSAGDTTGIERLAMLQSNLGNALSNSERTPEALEFYKESQRTYIGLINNGDTHFKHNLAGVTHNLARALFILQQPSKANDAFKAALNLRKSLVNKGDAHLSGELAGLLTDYGAALSKQDRTTEAIEAYLAARQIYERIASSGSTNLENAFIRLLNNFGKALQVSRKPFEALETFQTALCLLAKQSYSSPAALEQSSTSVTAIAEVVKELVQSEVAIIRPSIERSVKKSFDALNRIREFTPIFDPLSGSALKFSQSIVSSWLGLAERLGWYEVAADVVCRSHSRTLNQLLSIQLLETHPNSLSKTQREFLETLRELIRFDQQALTRTNSDSSLTERSLTIDSQLASRNANLSQIHRHAIVDRLRKIKEHLIERNKLQEILGNERSLRDHRRQLAHGEAILLLAPYQLDTEIGTERVYVCTRNTVDLVRWDEYVDARMLTLYLSFDSGSPRTIRGSLISTQNLELELSQISEKLKSEFTSVIRDQSIQWLSEALWGQLSIRLKSLGITKAYLITQNRFHDLPWLGTCPEKLHLSVYPSMSMIPLKNKEVAAPLVIEKRAFSVQILANDSSNIPDASRLWFVPMEVKALELLYEGAGYKVAVIKSAQEIENGTRLIAIGHGRHSDGNTYLLIGPDALPSLSHKELGAEGRIPSLLYASTCLAGKTSDINAEPMGLPTLMHIAGTTRVVGSLIAIDDLYAVITSIMVNQHIIDGKDINQALKITRTQLNSGHWDERNIKILQSTCTHVLPSLLRQMLIHLKLLQYNNDGLKENEINATQSALEVWYPSSLVGIADIDNALGQLSENSDIVVSTAFAYLMSTVRSPDQLWIARRTATFLVGLE
jgi:tetratricopeptide (TPR) repeat protein